MNVLAVDGALGAFSVALARDEQLVAARTERGSVALERGLPLLAGLLAATHVRPAQIERLAVGIGPGGFTGLRIAVAYAKSLAQAWSIPLVPISSFDLVEHGRQLENALSVVVGRPGVVSLRLRSGPAMRRASGRIEQALDAVLCDGEPVAQPLAVVGAPEDVLRALRERAIRVEPYDALVTPAAAAAAQLAFAREPAGSLHEVHADYGELLPVTAPKPRNLRP